MATSAGTLPRIARLLGAHAATGLSLVALAVLGAVVQGSAGFGAAILRTLSISALAQIAAASFYPALRTSPGLRTLALGVVCTVILLTPLLIPADAPLVRFVAALMSAVLTVKLYDLQVGARRGIRPDLWSFLFFLPNATANVLRKLDAERRPARPLRQLVQPAALLLLSVVTLAGLFSFDWSRAPFILEHAVKASAMFVFAISFVALIVGLARMVGLPARDFTDAPFLARTPADFWRRYNRPIQQFYYEDVFKPLGGRRQPAAATLLIFVLSALMHEYVFGVAIGRVQGYQTAFFLLQGCAVAATFRLKPTGAKAVFWIGATLAFNLLTSMLFFASADALLPIYSQELPRWLQGW